MDVNWTWIPTWHWMDHVSWHGHLDFFQKPLLGGRPNTNLGGHDTLDAHNRMFIIFYHVWGPAWKKIIEIAFAWGPGHIWRHTTLEAPWPHYMILEVCWDGLWTLSFKLSQFHDHGSWLVCEVALSSQPICWCYLEWNLETDLNLRRRISLFHAMFLSYCMKCYKISSFSV